MQVGFGVVSCPLNYLFIVKIGALRISYTVYSTGHYLPCVWPCAACFLWTHVHRKNGRCKDRRISLAYESWRCCKTGHE